MARTRFRVCVEPDCPTITDQARCPEHRRGTTTQRGLGHDYRKARDVAIADATRCTSCGLPFTDDNPATGGHVVARRDGGTLADGITAQCARCNYGWRRTGL